MILARKKFLKRQCRLLAKNLIFVDETGFHPGRTPVRGWSKKGQRLYGYEQYYSKGMRLTIIGAISIKSIVAKMTARGGVGLNIFKNFVAKHLSPILKPGHIVVWDNLNTHKNQEIVRMIKAKGARVLFTPPYSPEFNPIELAWSKLKHLIRKMKTRTIRDLQQAIYKAFRKISISDLKGWFKHAGYKVSQLQ